MAIVDYVNGAIVLLMVFLGFWAFAYAACLGPSMSVLRAIDEQLGRGMTRHEIALLFGSDKPISDILHRRLPKLVNGGYVVEEAGTYRLRPRGTKIAKLVIVLQRLVGPVEHTGK